MAPAGPAGQGVAGGTGQGAVSSKKGVRDESSRSRTGSQHRFKQRHPGGRIKRRKYEENLHQQAGGAHRDGAAKGLHFSIPAAQSASRSFIYGPKAGPGGAGRGREPWARSSAPAEVEGWEAGGPGNQRANTCSRSTISLERAGWRCGEAELGSRRFARRGAQESVVEPGPLHRASRAKDPKGDAGGIQAPRTRRL